MGVITIDNRTIRALRHVDTRRLAAGRYPFPDFLIVGPQKTASSWLHANLRRHPEVRMAREKEIFFFNLLDTPAHYQFRSGDLEWYSRFFRVSPAERLLHGVLSRLRYGRSYACRVSGESTASYAAMEEDLIGEIATLNPDIRVILLIRNPVDRAWSHARMDLLVRGGREFVPSRAARWRRRLFPARRGRFQDLTFEQFRAHYTSDYQLRCGAFTANIARWKRNLKPGRLLCLVSEQFRDRPVERLREVCRFLGIDASARLLDRGTAHRIVNASRAPLPMPGEHRVFLMSLFREEIERLNAAFGAGYPAE